MRIVVGWPEGAYPELRRELEQIPTRQRAERLRVLAMLGYAIMHKNTPVQAPVPSGPIQTPTVARPRACIRDAVQKLKVSVD